MIHYCLGFMFNIAMTEVCLIEKTNPDWQAGLLNGVGGKLNNEEFLNDHGSKKAMTREFEEETSVYHEDWIYKLSMVCKNKWQVDVFTTYTDKIQFCKTTTDEKIFIIPVNEFQTYNHVSNLSWLIPLCLDQGYVDYIICY